MALVEYEPVRCSQCKSILNPSCRPDFKAKTWQCPFCNTRQRFPENYARHISETTLPAELMPQYTTMEYILPSVQNIFPPIFVFVVDTCGYQEELDELKSSLQQCVNILPAQALIGFISFGKNAYVYDLSWVECTRCYAFRGDKNYTVDQIKEQLGLVGHDPRGVQSGARRFLMPAAECEFSLNSIIDELAKDAWPKPIDERNLRCIGNALNIAVSLLEISYVNQGARVLLFSSGAASYGPGRIVSEKLEDCIRTYHDIKNDNAKHLRSSMQFYQGLAQRAVNSGHAIDIFCCAIDQMGLMEMRSLAERTGGYLILTDSFATDVFKRSFQKILAREETGALRMCLNGQIEIFTSPGVKVSGAIGPGHSLRKKSGFVSDTEIGLSQTSAWKLNSLDSSTTIAFYLDISGQIEPAFPHGTVQFQTRYQHSSGRVRVRVTTVNYPFADGANINKFIQGFDQETAAVIMSRWAVYKSETEESLDVIRWLDRCLIRLAAQFGEYQHDMPNTFRLPREYQLYPQFMFHLRRSQLMETFNTSPDESAFFRTLLVRENVTNSLVMIMPALLQYSFESPQPQPVLLDVASMKNNVILLLDTFFTVVVWHGDTIVKWRNARYQDKPEYENFKHLLTLPLQDAESIIEQRFPVPKLVVCDFGKSQDRFIKAKVNPSGGGAGSDLADSGLYITDDISLKVFMDHLIKLAVKSQ